MKPMNTDDYALGYEQGLRDGREDGYADGWKDCTHVYESRLAQYVSELTMLNARITVLERNS